MAFSFFKGADSLFTEGIDLIKQGNMSKARDRLVKSIEKDGGPDDLSAVLVALIDMEGNLGNPSRYRALLDALRRCGAKEFEFGLTPLDRDMMIAQCELEIEKFEIIAAAEDDHVAQLEKGKRLVDLAQRYQARMGDENLKLHEIYGNDTTQTGTRIGMLLLAAAYESMASGTVWDNPRKAAEYQQIAYGYRKQLGESGDRNLELINNYSKSCKCWFCGRTASGAGIHFFTLPSDVSPMLAKSDDGEPLKSKSEGSEIYACRACNSTINWLAEAIARKYYESAIDQMRAMEARLQAEISSLQTQIMFVKG
ncbi:MAG: hypothetical protein GX224_00955 [Thermoplasmatales archaeon]|nr:hypothetical protein [Thermoplasmatales archaeon]